MKRFEKIKNISSPKLMGQYLVESFKECERPWDIWFFEKYCSNCQKIKIKDKKLNNGEIVSFTFCELNPHVCRVFGFVPNANIKATLWLESEVN